jgi:proteic killer suppression protein
VLILANFYITVKVSYFISEGSTRLSTTEATTPPYDATRASSPHWARRLTVEVLFTTEKLKRAMSANRALQRDWGADGAKKINLRLQQLAAAPTLEELRTLPGRCHELTRDRAGQLAVELHGGFRLIFRPSADPPPLKEDGGLDWGQVESVTVLEIVDYH